MQLIFVLIGWPNSVPTPEVMKISRLQRYSEFASKGFSNIKYSLLLSNQ